MAPGRMRCGAHAFVSVALRPGSQGPGETPAGCSLHLLVTCPPAGCLPLKHRRRPGGSDHAGGLPPAGEVTLLWGAGDDLVGLITLVLEDATVAGDSEELAQCFELWQKVRDQPRWTTEWAQLAMAAADNTALCLEHHCDTIASLVQPHAGGGALRCHRKLHWSGAGSRCCLWALCVMAGPGCVLARLCLGCVFLAWWGVTHLLRLPCPAGAFGERCSTVDPKYVANFGEEVVRSLPVFMLR